MEILNISIFQRHRGESISVPQCACLCFPYFTILIAMHHAIIQKFKLFFPLIVVACIFNPLPFFSYSTAEHNPSSFPYLHGWVEARVKQGFIFNDVADSRHYGLV